MLITQSQRINVRRTHKYNQTSNYDRSHLDHIELQQLLFHTFILVHKIPPLLRGTNCIEAEEAEAASTRMQQQEDEQEEEEHLRTVDNEAAEATTRLLKQQEEEERLQILEAEATETV